MGLYGGDAPKPDKSIGKAAELSAQLGIDYLDWTKDRAKTTDGWAAADRSRAKTVFEPLQDQFIKEAQAHDSVGAQRVAAMTAAADVTSQTALAEEASKRDLASMGVNPNSGRFRSVRRAMGIDTGLARAGAMNMARNRVRAEGRALRGDAINMGGGLAVNPLSSFTAGSSGVASGTNAAIGGVGQKISALQGQQDYKMAGAQMNADASAGMMEGIGTLAGFAMFSDEDMKTNKRKARAALPMMRDMRVDDWEYKDGMGDGGGVEHTGTYAQDFQKATGKGDGHTIPIVSAIGVTMKAVKELDAKLTRIARGITKAAA